MSLHYSDASLAPRECPHCEQRGVSFCPTCRNTGEYAPYRPDIWVDRPYLTRLEWFWGPMRWVEGFDGRVHGQAIGPSHGPYDNESAALAAARKALEVRS